MKFETEQKLKALNPHLSMIPVSFQFYNLNSQRNLLEYQTFTQLDCQSHLENKKRGMPRVFQKKKKADSAETTLAWPEQAVKDISFIC